MDLAQKMKEYLVAAAKVDRKRGQIFSLYDVEHWLQWDPAECKRVAARLEREGLLNRLPNGEAILTTAGITLAERS